MLPQQALKTNGNSARPQNKKSKPLVQPLLRPCGGRSSGQHMLPQQPIKTNGNSNVPPARPQPHKRIPLRIRSNLQAPRAAAPAAACVELAGPPANTCPCNNPQNKRQQRPPTKQKIKAPRAAAPAAACVAGRSTGQHMPPQQALKTNGNSARSQNKKSKPLVLPLLRRHAWLAGPPANTCPRNNSALKTNGNSARPQNKKSKPLVLPLLRRHAWLAAPPANTCLRNKPSKQTATTPATGVLRATPESQSPTRPPFPRNSGLRAASGEDGTRGRHAPNPQRAPAPQNKNQRRHNPRAASPEAARRRMTTPVVRTPHEGNNRSNPPWSWKTKTSSCRLS